MTAERGAGRRLSVAISLAIAVVVLVGFAPTYYLRPGAPHDPLPLHIRVHGLLFTAWIALLVVQATLVARGRTSWHRSLGWSGAALAFLMVVAGSYAGIQTARREAGFGLGDEAEAFLTIPLFSMAAFAVLVASAVFSRHRPRTHKRLMLLATISLLDAPIARWPGAPGAVGVFVLVDLFVVAGMLHDLVSRRRVHPAYLWGGAFVLASQVLRDPVGRLDIWHAVARLLIG